MAEHSVPNTPVDTKQVVTPWEVEGEDEGIDYTRLVRDFGCHMISPELLERFEKVTGKTPHRFLRRGLFFSHRDLEVILNLHEAGKPFFLYTGRGPSSSALHLGHLIPFMFTKWLQDTFDVPLVIQLTDDEKYLFKEDLLLPTTQEMGFENSKDIIACGFDVNKTFIFRNSKNIHTLYPVALDIMKKTTFNQVRGIFGFDGSTNIGMCMFPAIQAAPSFSAAFPSIFGGNPHVQCLIPCAIDQDPYFRMTRDVAPRLNLHKPALIHAKFIPALQGHKTKMSGSVANTSVYVTDTPNEIKKKINKHAFSGGGMTLEEHRANGANLDVDIAYNYLQYFMEDDEELARIGEEYESGRMLTGEVKAELIKILQELVLNHNSVRKTISDELVMEYMKEDRPCFERFKEAAKVCKPPLKKK